MPVSGSVRTGKQAWEAMTRSQRNKLLRILGDKVYSLDIPEYDFDELTLTTQIAIDDYFVDLGYQKR